MVGFKNFMKIRYPEFENERIVFNIIRPNIETMNNRFEENNCMIDLLTLLYKGEVIKSEIRKAGGGKLPPPML